MTSFVSINENDVIIVYVIDIKQAITRTQFS